MDIKKVCVPGAGLMGSGIARAYTSARPARAYRTM